MISGFEKIVEERIRRAIERGEFDATCRRGASRSRWSTDRHIAEDLRLAYKILKNAECLPPEVELRKDIEKTEDLLAAMPETADKYQALKKLNFLILKLNAMRQYRDRKRNPAALRRARSCRRLEARAKRKRGKAQ
ncbi:MAG: DUF1992 domain-containing protein [Desulfobacterales bacterium]|nr:DUF1992 domain-containing protein [Desulfobacterales bacterium]